jgi:DNA-binding HxlR family transcriptional regulator
MSSKQARASRSGCPISTALELVGDPWSLLIVRDLLFKKLHTFKEFAAAGEGIASNILAERLQRLEANGIVSKHADRQDQRRYVYRLTQKGFDLGPVLMELVIWAAKHEKTAAPEPIVREMKSRRRQLLGKLRREWQNGEDRS